ncbi:MAG: hypothetical protein IKO99_09475 [Bacteroidales bacterium]|nr:hypothetical protein [Bacteroidales bacterium]
MDAKIDNIIEYAPIKPEKKFFQRLRDFCGWVLKGSLKLSGVVLLEMLTLVIDPLKSFLCKFLAVLGGRDGGVCDMAVFLLRIL